MNGQAYLLLPLTWAMGYALCGVILKRALDGGAGALRLAFISSLVAGVMFAPGLARWPTSAPASALQWPLLASLIYFVSQICVFVAMRLGDVTVLAPTMGIKVVFVAAFTVLLGAGPVPWTWWVGACLATSAVFLLGVSDLRARKQAGTTVALAAAAAAMYAACDVMTQMHAREIGAPVFSAIMFLAVAGESLLLLPFFREPLRAIPRRAWPWALAGCVVGAAQSGGMAITLGAFGHATAVNIIYSTRGLWSILLVWVAGPWFGNQERAAGTAVMGRRMAGALLLLGAVGLVLVK
jgi:drug/metabolite transporter (DMT)-like permease